MATGPADPRTPGLGEDPLQRGLMALQQGRPDEAERLARAVLLGHPQHPRAMHVLGCALLMQGRAFEAIQPLEQAGRGRHDPEIDTQLAIALRQIGRPNDALVRLRRASKRRPAYPPAFHELGFLLAALGRHDEAAAALQQGLELAPMMPELSIQLGHVQLMRNDRAAAKAAFARALAVAPDAPDALSGMGTALMECGEHAPAAEHFRRALRARPDDQETWVKLGICLIEIGNSDAGYGCLRTAVRTAPGLHGKVLATLVKCGRGRFWLRPSDAVGFLRGETN
jgi:Flp pilus assembly protein TadD